MILSIDPTTPLAQAYHGGPFCHIRGTYSEDSKTIEQQVEILVNRGLIINNLERAKEFLNQVNYYRFSGHLKLFSVNDVFNTNTTFESIVQVYNFDCELRKVLNSFLGYVEIMIKTQLAYNLSVNINATCYLNKNNFLDEDRFNSLQEDIKDSITRRYFREVFVQHFNDDYLPIINVKLNILNFVHVTKI